MDCKNDRVFKNILGTCWMVSIFTLLCFSNVTKDVMESLKYIKDIDSYIRTLLQSKMQDIDEFFPTKYRTIPNREESLFNMLKAFIIRYQSKLEIIPKVKIDASDLDNPLRCERLIHSNFINLMSFYKKLEGGNLIYKFYLANIFSLCFLGYNLFFKNYYPNQFTNLTFDTNLDIGILFWINGHVCCGFFCGTSYKFYNDHDKKIYDFDWRTLFINLKENEGLFVVSGGIKKLDINQYYDNIIEYLEYKQILSLTVISKRSFEVNLEKQIKDFFNDNYNDISDYELLYIVFIKTNKFIDLFKLSKSSHSFALYELWKYLNLNKVESIKYLKLSLQYGQIKGAYQLGKIYFSKKDLKNAKKYLYIAFLIDTINKKDSAKLLYDIYFNYEKKYRIANRFYSSYELKESIKDRIKLKDFEELKKLADQEFIDLQYEVGEKYLNDGNYSDAIKYFKKVEKTAIETNETELLNKVRDKIKQQPYEIIQKPLTKEQQQMINEYYKENIKPNKPLTKNFYDDYFTIKRPPDFLIRNSKQ